VELILKMLPSALPSANPMMIVLETNPVLPISPTARRVRIAVNQPLPPLFSPPQPRAPMAASIVVQMRLCNARHPSSRKYATNTTTSCIPQEAREKASTRRISSIATKCASRPSVVSMTQRPRSTRPAVHTNLITVHCTIRVTSYGGNYMIRLARPLI